MTELVEGVDIIERAAGLDWPRACSLLCRVPTWYGESARGTVPRWCERFAAEVLMPAQDVGAVLRQQGWTPGATVTNLDAAAAIARRFKVSLRAAVIRLVTTGAATWDLYDQIPVVADKKPEAGGGTGRSRTEIREDQFGDRVASVLINAVEKDVISRSQAVDFLDIPDSAFDDLARPAHGA